MCCREALRPTRVGRLIAATPGLITTKHSVGSFGDSPEMATELANLVVAGIKRATASLARDHREGRDPLPRPGDFVIMLDGTGCPRFIWRTTGNG